MSSSEPRWLGGYHLQRRLGAGGAGTVWEATDEGGMRVALKILHPILAATDEGRQRLEREARLVNQIPGSGIARVLDFETEATSPFVVTQLIEGPTLAEMVSEAELTVDECFHLAVQLEDLLHRVHEAGIVHRDLKPSNIIISENGPVLIDFGIAQGAFDDRLTQSGQLTGTPGYVSPELLVTMNPQFEQWRQGDWWAWTALLLSSLTGLPPFGTGRPEIVLQRVARGEPELGGLAEPLRSLFRKAFDPDPRNRPDAWEIIETLNEAKSDSAATASIPGPKVLAPTRDLLRSNPAIPPSVITPIAQPAMHHPGENVPLSQPPPPAPADMQAGHFSSFPHFGYTSPRLATYPFAVFTVVTIAALLPAWWGAPGLIIGSLILLALGATGVGNRWRENRRQRAGERRSSDNALTSALIPRHLIVAALQLLPGFAAGVLAGIGGWYLVFLQAKKPEMWGEALLTWINDPELAGVSPILVWLLGVTVFGVTAIFPTSGAVRRGIAVTVGTLIPEKMARTVLYLLLMAMVATLLLLLFAGAQ